MRLKTVLLAGIFALVLILAGCAKAECRKDADCTKPHFTGTCVNKVCTYKPIPNECGNTQCETNENKCTCPVDCGTCTGKSGKYLTQQCKGNECIEDIPASAQKPVTITRELTISGSKASLITTFNQPFNLQRDQIKLDFALNVQQKGISGITINRLELTGTTPDKRTITLAEKQTNKQLPGEGAEFTEWLVPDFPTSEKDGEITSLNLKVYADHSITSGTTTTPKSIVLPVAYQALKFAWAKPTTPPSCPASCDDKNPGTRDYCDAQTNYHCEHEPVPNACGNGICDAQENQCTCAKDCGRCTGSTAYLVKNCVANNCVNQLKTGITIQPQSIFDEAKLSIFSLQNTYKYNKPFNTKKDKFSVEFTLYQKQENVDDITIRDVRILDGTQEIASALGINKKLKQGEKQEVQLAISPTEPPEQDRTFLIRIWYSYKQDGQEKTGEYSKPLGKTTLITPDVT